MGDLAGQSLGFELGRQAGVQRDQQVGLLRQLVPAARACDELELVRLEQQTARFDPAVVELAPRAGLRGRHDRRHVAPPPRPKHGQQRPERSLDERGLVGDQLETLDVELIEHLRGELAVDGRLVAQPSPARAPEAHRGQRLAHADP